MNVSRRSLITGIGCIIAAPAIVRASSLMAIKPVAKLPPGWVEVDCRLVDLNGKTSFVRDRFDLARIRELLLPGLYEVQGEYQNIAVEYAEILNEPHRSMR